MGNVLRYAENRILLRRVVVTAAREGPRVLARALGVALDKLKVFPADKVDVDNPVEKSAVRVFRRAQLEVELLALAVAVYIHADALAAAEI